MSQLRSALLAAAALAMATGNLVAPAAHAEILTSFDFNLQNTACGGSCTAINNVAWFTLGNGYSVVNQTLVGGSPNNQPFTETGLVQLVGGVTDTFAAFNIPAAGIPSTDILLFSLNLSGTYNTDGSLSFNGGSDVISLYLSPNTGIGSPTNPTLPSGSTLLAQFNMDPVHPASGVFSVTSNGVPSGSFGVTLNVDTASLPGPLFSFGGNSLDSIVLELANIQPAKLNVSPNPVLNNPNPLLATSEKLYLTETGQLQLEVPEPSTLALFGSALIGFVVLTERRRRKQTAIS